MEELGDISRDRCDHCILSHAKVQLSGSYVGPEFSVNCQFHWSPNDFNFPGSADELKRKNYLNFSHSPLMYGTNRGMDTPDFYLSRTGTCVATSLA